MGANLPWGETGIVLLGSLAKTSFECPCLVRKNLTLCTYQCQARGEGGGGVRQHTGI